MTTYSQGTIRRREIRGKWEWQALITITNDNGTKTQKTKLLGISCDPLTKEERGKGRRIAPRGKGVRQAYTALQTWRDELIAQDANTEQEQTDNNAQTAKLVPEYVKYYWDSRTIEPGTKAHYETLHKHIDCELLRIPIADLTPTIVQDWKKWMADEAHLGASVQNKCFNQLKYACKFGVEMQQLEKNPCTPVKAPKRNHHEPNPLDSTATATIRKKAQRHTRERPCHG